MTEQARKLLIVEDDPALLKQLKWCFEGYDVSTAENRVDAITALRRHEPAVVLQDNGLLPTDESTDGGIATLADVLRLAPHTKVIVLIDNVDQGIAVDAVAQGAHNFYKKPIDPDTLRLIVNRAFAIHELEGENRRLQNQVNEVAAGRHSCGQRRHACRVPHDRKSGANGRHDLAARRERHG